jgi:hypothetical protein
LFGLYKEISPDSFPVVLSAYIHNCWSKTKMIVQIETFLKCQKWKAVFLLVIWHTYIYS